VTVAIRPEDIRLTDPGTVGSLEAHVERIVDLGAFRTIDVTVGEIALKVQIAKGRSIAIGERIGLVLDQAVLFDAAGAVRDVRFAGPKLVSELQHG
jgi:ABC-type sugar transport system ATPase subunit